MDSSALSDRQPRIASGSFPSREFLPKIPGHPPSWIQELRVDSDCQVQSGGDRSIWGSDFGDRTLGLLDETVQPESTSLRVALAPVAIPVGTAALALDAVLVHPVAVIPDAALDVYDLYWK